MPTDMKRTIADAAKTILLEKKKSKLTVKDIVDECHITRQAFYYHFADIPDLIEWIISQREDKLLQDFQSLEHTEEQFRYWSLIILNGRSSLRKIEQSSYGKEIEGTLFSHLINLFRRVSEENETFHTLDPFEQDLFVRYHCYAAVGILRSWDENNQIEDLDRIVHDIHIFASGHLELLSRNRTKQEKLQNSLPCSAYTKEPLQS